jgi:excisionase family DNA binding protein
VTDRPWVTVAQLAERARVNTRTVQREIGRGNLTADLTGTVYLITSEEADRWLAGFEKYSGLRKENRTQK